MTFVRYISGDYTNNIDINFKETHTAATNQSRGGVREMVLPVWALTPAMWSKTLPFTEEIPPEDYGAATITMLTGMIVHESRHMKVSFSTPEQALYAAKKDLDDVEHPQIVKSLMQTVEDLYVDDQNYQQPYGIFTALQNELLFPQKLDDFLVETFDGSMKSKATLILDYKNPYFRSHPFWNAFPEIVAKLNEAITEGNPVRRVELAFEIYELIKDDSEEDAKNTQSLSSWDGSNGDKDLNFRPQDVSEALDEAGISVYQLQQKMQEKSNNNDASMDRIPAVYENDVLKAPGSFFDNNGYNIQPASEFAAFGRMLRLLRSKNYVPGLPSDRGHRIVNTRLNRIITDQKIFGPPEERRNQDRREIRIAVDMSGSMTHMLKEVLSAAYGLYDGLRDSMIPCVVYVHTTTKEFGVSTPILLKVADNTSADLAHRFHRASQLDNRETVDGNILTTIGKTFSRTPVRKALIMLCDGEPNCAPYYQGPRATEHTKKSVEALRKQGIVVFVMSLDRDVYQSNDYIYGEDFNIKADHDLERQLQQLVVKLTV